MPGRFSFTNLYSTPTPRYTQNLRKASYDVMFAGIPYQDPTPEMLARYAHHARIASMMGWCGVAVFLFGVVAGIIRRVTRKPAVVS